MGVVRVEVVCECDGCGKRFGVELETSEDLQLYKDFEQLTRQVIKDGAAGYEWHVRGKHTIDRISLNYQPTIQGGMMLCDVCSKKCDALPIDVNLTEQQVIEAIEDD